MLDLSNIVEWFIQANNYSIFIFFRALKLSSKQKVKEALAVIKKECTASSNPSFKTKYILNLLTAYFDEEIDHILRVFEVNCVYCICIV